MRFLTRCGIAVALLLCVSHLSAQTLRLFGKVELDSKTKKYKIACTTIPLSSTSVDLSKVGSGVLEMTGKNKGTLLNPDIEVLTAKPSPTEFKLSGNGSIGKKIYFEVKDTSGAATMLCWVSFQPSFLPMEPYTQAFSGTWYLDVRWLLFVTLAPLVNGSAKVDLPIPDVPALIGLPVHGQGATWGAQLPLVFVNPDCVVLKQKT